MKNLDRGLYLNVWGVYALKDNIKNRIYIGSSKNLYSRINSHFKKLKANIHYNVFLQNHVNKYGVNSLEVIILETNHYKSLKELREREQYYINIHYNKDCFNAHNKVDFNNSNILNNKHLSDVTKLFWQVNYIKLKPIVIKNLEKARVKFREKINNGTLIIESPMKNKQHKESSKKKMSQSALLRGRHKSTLKKVYQYDLNGKFIKEFDCIKDAAKIISNNKLVASNISACCLGKRNHALNYTWRFTKHNNIPLNFTLKNLENNEEIQFTDMSFIAKHLKCNPSTISRAVKHNLYVFNKYKIIKNE